MAISEERARQLEDGANMRTGGTIFDYVDTAKLERLGIGKYLTSKPKGNNFMRIVARCTTEPFAKKIYQHTKVGSNKATYLCLNEMYGESCPACDHIQELRRQNIGNDVIKELEASRRFLLFVVDTADDNSIDEGPKWMDCPPSIYKNVCLLCKDRRTGEKIDPTDPVDGRDIEFLREDGKITKYTGFVLVKDKPIPESWYKDLPSFDEILLKPDPDEMLVAVKGIKTASTEDAGDGRRESRKRETTREVESEKEDKGESRRESRRENTRESRQEDVSESRRESTEDNSEQATAIKSKIDEIQKRRSQRSGE